MAHLKNTLRIAAGAVLVSGSAFAADPIYSSQPMADEPMPLMTASVELLLGGAILSSNDVDEFNHFEGGQFILSGRGKAYYDKGDKGLQFEVFGIGDTFAGGVDGEAEKAGSTHVVGGVHHLWDVREDRAVGAFLALSHTNFYDESESAVHVIGALEAAHFFSPYTAFGQLGFVFNPRIGDGASVDTWNSGVFALAGGRYFIDDYRKLEGTVAAGWGPGENEEVLTWFQWAAEYEHQYMDSPFSATARYQGDYMNDGLGEHVTSHAFMVSLTMQFGGLNLYQANMYRHGIFEIPDLRVPLGWSDEL